MWKLITLTRNVESLNPIKIIDTLDTYQLVHDHDGSRIHRQL